MKPLYWTRIIAAPAATVVPPTSTVPNTDVLSPTDTTASIGLPAGHIDIDTPDSSTSSPIKSPKEAIDEVDPIPAPPGSVPHANTTSPTATGTTTPPGLWHEIDETPLENLPEFTDLFSRRATVPAAHSGGSANGSRTAMAGDAPATAARRTKIQTVKVLDAKRSQSVGIFARSLHIDFAEIEHAIYHCDTSVVSLEQLTQMMDMKATVDELRQIEEAAASGQPLDAPEEFLLRISRFSHSSERIACIVFQADFDERCTAIARKVSTVTQLCRQLLESQQLRHLFSIILTLGNYMNGGNHQRGQADGFGLEILGKLKDVKSSDPRVTLLHFIVRTYVRECRRKGELLHELQMPVPDAADVNRALAVDFVDLGKNVAELRAALTDCTLTSDRVVVESTAATVQPFKDLMAAFVTEADERIERQAKRLDESQALFRRTLRFFRYQPKSGAALADCTPAQFFEHWEQFTTDFRDIWKKEMEHCFNE